DPVAGRMVLEYTWHVLGADPGTEVRWNLPPGVHAIHVAELTAWSTHPDRTPEDLTALLRTATTRVEQELRRYAPEE
uniref:DUF6197 family protein n=1 Tax=Pseudonocardia pini TaxID=2758030 RepID=UPI0015F1131F